MKLNSPHIIYSIHIRPPTKHCIWDFIFTSVVRRSATSQSASAQPFICRQQSSPETIGLLRPTTEGRALITCAVCLERSWRICLIVGGLFSDAETLENAPQQIIAGKLSGNFGQRILHLQQFFRHKFSG